MCAREVVGLDHLEDLAVLAAHLVIESVHADWLHDDESARLAAERFFAPGARVFGLLAVPSLAEASA
jgi:hypothetical protein